MREESERVSKFAYNADEKQAQILAYAKLQRLANGYRSPIIDLELTARKWRRDKRGYIIYEGEATGTIIKKSDEPPKRRGRFGR